MKTANFNQKNTKYTPTRYFLSRHLGHLKPPRTFLTRHLFIDGHLLPSEYDTIYNRHVLTCWSCCQKGHRTAYEDHRAGFAYPFLWKRAREKDH